MKKKAVKIAAATAVAASAFVATAPISSEAASSVSVEVSKAVTAMKQAYHTYSDVTATGKFAEIEVVYADYNAAKKAYANAKALVEKSKDAKKDAYLAELETTYADYIAKRVVTYIDAYNYATINLEANTAALKAAIEAKDAVKVEAVYHEISKQLKTRTVILDRVYGETTRDLFRNGLKKAAQDLRDSMVYDVTVGMKLRDADVAIKAGKLEDAKLALDKAAEFLPKTTTFKTELTAANATVVAAYEALVTPKVTSVSAINAKELVVTFNKAIDKATVIAADNTLVDGIVTIVALQQADGTASTAITADTAAASLSEDGKTLTITPANAEVFNGQYTVAINKGVKDAAAVAVPAFTSVLTFKDTVAPAFVSASAVAKTSTNQVTLTFSEPVQASGVIAYVNGTAVAVQAGTKANQLVVTTGSALNAGSQNEISLLNVKDFSGNFITPNPFKTSFTVTADTAAPTVTEVKVVGENKIEVTYSKNVSQASFVNNARILDANGVLVTLLNASVTGNKATLTAASALTFGPNGTFTGSLLLGTDIADSLGNKAGSTYTQSVTFTKDTVAPQVASIGFASGKLNVTFNENVTAFAADLTGATVINNTTGVITDLSSIAFGLLATNASIVDNNKLVVPVALAAGDYTLRLPANVVKDGSVAINKNASTITTFTVSATAPGADSTKPAFTYDAVATTSVNVSVAGTNADAEQIVSYVVQDASGLDLASVRDVNNYTLDGKALPVGTYITTNFSGTDSAALTVSIHLDSTKVTVSKSTYKLVVSNVKDKAGNIATPQVSEDLALIEGVKPELSSAAISAGDATTLVLGFSEDVTGVSAADFVFTVNGTDVTGAATLTPITAGTDKGKYYVTFATVADSGKLYFDLDGSTTFNAGDVEIATTADAAGTLNLSKSYVTGVKAKVATSATIVDGDANGVVLGTEKVAK